MAKVENDRKALIAKQNSLAYVRKWAAGPVLVGPTDKQYWEFIKTNTGPVAYITLNPGMPFTNTIASPADLYKNVGAPAVETTITIKMQTERPTPLMLRDGIIWR